ncbi:O-antigen ligase family protein [Ulvibacterium sp.]|uniref:O-antigen ligase family protein n=1 Tax=Ulvibacterium sp. TaxID=2665914 RepID=UPI002626DD4D|nr:O-antigen ligase family protein [Ulvibacterium sp.]
MFYTEGDWVIKTFWNSLFVAFFLMPCGINLPSPFFIISMGFGMGIVVRDREKFVFEPAMLLFPLYFVLMCTGLLYTENLHNGIDLIQRSLSLLLFPVIFMFVKEDAATVKRLFDFLLAGLLISFCINFFNATLGFVSHILENTSTMGIFPIFDLAINEWHTFYLGSAFSKWVNPNYISIYILLVLGYYLKNKLVSRNRLLVVLLLFAYIFLLASIAAYVILGLMSILLLIDVDDKQRKYTGIIIFILGVTIFLNNPRVYGFYELVKDFNGVADQEVGVLGKAKVLSWDASIKLILEAPILGYGTGDANDALMEKYEELGYGFNFQNQYNAHNQFLQTYLQTGFAGFAVLLVIFVLLALRLKGGRHEFSVFLILFISLLAESMLVRFNGIVFFSIVVPLLLKKRSILGGRVIRNTEKVIPLKL